METQCKVCDFPGKGNCRGVYSCRLCASAFSTAYNPVTKIPPCRKNRKCYSVEDNCKGCGECRLRKSLDVGMRHYIIKNPLNPYQGNFRMTNLQELLTSLRQAHQRTKHRTEPTYGPSMQNKPKSSCAVYSIPHSKAPVPDAIEGVEEFATELFKFGGVPKSNRVTLKDGMFGVLLVRLARTFNSERKTLTCWNGQVVMKEGTNELDDRKSFWEDVFGFSEIVYDLKLSDEEVSLFCLVIMVNVYHLNRKSGNPCPVIALNDQIYNILMDILTDVVKNNRPEDPTNFFTVFNILLFRISYLKEQHKKIQSKIIKLKKTNEFRYPSVPHQNTESSSQLAVRPKGSQTFIGQHIGSQRPFFHRLTAPVDKSVPNPSSSILSNPIVCYNPLVQQGSSMPPAKNAELKRRIGMQNEDFVPHDEDYFSRQGIESSSDLSVKKSCPGQDQMIIEGKNPKRSDDLHGSSTDYSAIYKEGLQNMHHHEHLKQTCLAKPVNTPPIATEDSKTFPSGDMPSDLTSKSITMNEKEDSFIDVVSVEPVHPISNAAKQEKYLHKKFRSSPSNPSVKPKDSSTGSIRE